MAVKARTEITLVRVNDGEGIPGPPGKDGNTTYLHIKYSDDGGTTFTSNNGESPGKYMGQYVDFYQLDSMDPTKYTWQQIEGEPGKPGDKGEPGKDGKDAAIIGKTAPEDKSYLWCDISVTPPLIKRRDGSEWVVVNDQTQNIQLIYKNIDTAILENNDSIMLQVGEKTYEKDEVDRLIGGVNTQYQQLSDQFIFKFNQFAEEIGAVSNNSEKKFTEINKYIRFVDGAIIIGVEGNPLILKMQNDRISFLENNNEVAYISNRRMYITDAEVTSSLTIGIFAFTPRNNGNLSFKKVR